MHVKRIKESSDAHFINVYLLFLKCSMKKKKKLNSIINMLEYLLITASKTCSSIFFLIKLLCCEGAWNFNLGKNELESDVCRVPCRI